MITITKMTGDKFLTINYDKNIPIEYNEMKKIFDKNIQINSYYMLIKDNDKIYTNLYDIYEIKFNKSIILDDLNIIYLPYDKKDVEYIKKIPSYQITNELIDFPNEELRNDKLFVLMAVNHNSIYYEKISDKLKYDKQIIHNAVMENYECKCLEYIPYEYKNNKEFMKKYIKYNGCNIRYVSNELKNDEELVNLSIENEFRNGLEYLSDYYKDNEDFIKPLLIKYPRCFEYISKRLQNKKEIIMLCIEKLKELNLDQNYNKILSLINDINKNDKEIVLPLISMNGYHILYIIGDLLLDKDIVYAAIKNDPTTYKYIDISFFNNKEFILLCLGNSKYSNGYDEENYEYFLEGLDKKFKDDKEIVIASIKKCCKNFIHCSKRLKNNKEVILTAINNCYYDFYNNMEENDKIDYIKKRIKNIDIILENTKLKNDPDILNQVIKKIRIV
jgi:CII-binding regulator of phage lambda lysogenization HflD